MFPLNQSQAYCARFFLDDFLECRNQFREIITSNKHLNSRHQIFSNTVDDSEYDCDVYYVGNENASKLIVIISGTHGIEGFCGSAIQRYLLAENSTVFEKNSDYAFLFIHALNPWGMASGFPHTVNVTIVVIAFVVTVLLGLVFGTYPAVKAARMDPVEALRNE